MSKNLLVLATFLAIAVGSGTSTAQDLERGRTLFNLCAQCHGARGEGNQEFLAPTIAGQNEWYLLAQLRKFRSGVRGTHFDDIGGMRMRPMALTLQSDEDVADVAAYVASLPLAYPEPVLTGGDPAKGEVTFKTICITCHMEKGQGSQQFLSPRLARMSDWYLLTQLQNFRAGVRGSDPTDAQALLMRPMALSLPDEQALRDVIAYAMTLPQ